MRIDGRLAATAAVTTASAWTSAAFSVAALVQLHFADRLAMYAAARSVPVAVAALAAWLCGAWREMRMLGLLMTAIQLADGLIGFAARDYPKAVGPVVLALLNAGALILGRSRASGPA